MDQVPEGQETLTLLRVAEKESVGGTRKVEQMFTSMMKEVCVITEPMQSPGCVAGLEAMAPTPPRHW
jgi:hypothetical protein